MSSNDNIYENLFSDDLIKNLVVGIGEVSDITGVPTRKIRYWEEKGMISSLDSSSSVRRYNYITIKKIILIKELIDEGYTLDSASKKVEERIGKLNDAFEKMSNREE